ncbi:MAG: DNRLRE domain-containing protein [Anaerolineae bacterium]|nr:DNRLRE domain-containing protein [Anaerolineae bacterium]
MKNVHTRQKVSRIFISLIIVSVLAGTGVTAFTRANPARANSTLTFTTVADSYVNQSDPSKNFGTNPSIRVDGSPVVRSFLSFNISGISGTISKVTLQIFANSSSSSGFDVNKISNTTWQEKSITYNNAPALGDKVGTSKKFSSNNWVSTDVTPLLNADGAISIALTGIDSTAINLAAREDNSHAAQLLVEVASSATSTATRTSPPGATSTSPATPAPTAARTNVPTATSINPPNPTSTQPNPAPTQSGDIQPGFPIRAVFYYPWFPEAWNQQGYNPFTNYTPSLGFYDSSSVSTIQKHISNMTYGNISAAILSWWGQGSRTDQRVGTILGATPGSSNPNFRWSIYYENESLRNPTLAEIQNDLQYIQSHYGSNPSFLRVNGKFVVFVYADATDGCGMADRWVQANNELGHPAYIVLKVFSGYRYCANQPDSWHQYSPAVATDEQKGYSYAISPGFWKKGEAARLARDLTKWTANVRSMVASGDPWQLVTTFNEWGEGTSVESASEWVSASGNGQYLDVLHDNGNTVPPPPIPTVQPTNTPIFSPTPSRTGTPSSPTSTPIRTSTPPGPSPTPTQTATLPGPGPTPTRTSTPPPGNDPILFFVSDLVSGGSLSRAQAVVNLINNLMSQHPNTQMLVASGGDNEQESSPTVSNYQNYFGTTFGTFVTQGIYMQVRGNHDIQSAGSYTDYDGTVHNTGAAYWNYFGANARMHNIEGKKLTDYSYDLGTWHIIGLDQLNGSVNQPTLDFLTSDLAAHSSTTCQLVYWHVPTYSSGASHGDSPNLKPLNQAEYNAGVDIQLNGHDHDYQRFYPINPSGTRDDARGITTFVAGIGAEDNRTGSQTSIAQAASAVYMDTFPPGTSHAIGVIMFTLHANSADYKLYDANNGSVIDQGTVVCH